MLDGIQGREPHRSPPDAWNRTAVVCVHIGVFVFFALPYVHAEGYGHRLGVRYGKEVQYFVQGVTVAMDALDPSPRKWYVPQELFPEYQWRQWETTNYAERYYRRYMPVGYEGEYWYDLFGNLVSRGWLWMDWRHTSGQQFGSSLWKMPGPSIAGDSRGAYSYRIGYAGRTTLTPLTLSKPDMRGLRMDLASDRADATVVLSRISLPPGIQYPLVRTNATMLMGGRLLVHIGEFVTAGGTLVNAHQSQTVLEPGKLNPLKGTLTTEQNRHDIAFLQIRLSDDSPEDGEGGAALFSQEIILTDINGNRVTGSEIRFRPRIEGGAKHPSYLAADGTRKLTLTYDFEDPTYDGGPEPSRIRRITVRLVVANDYRIEVTSNAQTNADNRPVFLPVARARGNIKDWSNRETISFDYGLPTATTIFGCTLDVVDWRGFSFQGELDLR